MTVQDSAVLDAVEAAAREPGGDWPTARQICRQMPGVSPNIVHRKLAELVAGGQLTRAMRERTPRYRVAQSTHDDLRREIEDATRRLAETYDPSDPSKLVGMMYPWKGELREIIDAKLVDGQMYARFSSSPERITIIFTTPRSTKRD